MPIARSHQDLSGRVLIVETTITAQNALVDLGQVVMANALTYNGQIPGPQFRLKVGDRVIVHFANKTSRVP